LEHTWQEIMGELGLFEACSGWAGESDWVVALEEFGESVNGLDESQS